MEINKHKQTENKAIHELLVILEFVIFTCQIRNSKSRPSRINYDISREIPSWNHEVLALNFYFIYTKVFMDNFHHKTG